MPKTVHEVQRGSNLDLLLRGFHGIGNRFVDALLAIALALSTKDDNSADVKAMIQKLDTAGESLKDAVNKNQLKPN